MPLPLLLVALGGYGVKKGFDAKSDIDKAKRIGERAEREHRRALAALKTHKEETNLVLEQLGQYKANVFINQIKQLVDVINKNKSASSRLKGFNEGFSESELVNIEHGIETSLALTSSMIILGGAVMGIGPALAISGFMMASKAEKALTQAYQYDARIGIAVAQMETSGVMLEAIQRGTSNYPDFAPLFSKN